MPQRPREIEGVLVPTCKAGLVRGGKAGDAGKAFLALVACAAVVLAPCCARSARISSEVDAEDLDHRILRYTYIEDGNLATVAVNTEATRRREKSEYVPIAIGIANNGTRPLTINRESLVLVDDGGRRYPMASVREVRSLGSRVTMDLRVSNTFASIFARRMVGRSQAESVFFPIPVTEPGFWRRATVRNTIELPRDSWMVDVIYFPHPERALLDHRYELWLSTRELENPIFVKFAVE